MNKINLIQITEHIPPSLNGIGQYAYKLAEQLQQKYDVSTSFLLIDEIENSSPKCNLNFDTYYLSQLQTSLEAALNLLIKQNFLQNNIILLHFDRGLYDRFINKRNYDRYSLAFHLTQALSNFKKLHPAIKLIIVLHEFLYPFIPRTRDYLLRPLQNHYMRSLIKLADTLVCSNPVVEQQIKQLYASAKINVIPVFSNIQEPKWEQLPVKKAGHWVLFGSTDNLKRNTLNFIQHLSIIKKQLPLNQVDIIGGYRNLQTINLVNQLKNLAIKVDYHPDLPNENVSDFFAQAQFCYQYYFDRQKTNNSTLIFKSGVFANASAHGVISVMGNQGMEAAFNCFGYPGFIYMQNNQLQINFSSQFDLWAEQIHSWYQQNSSLARAVQTFWYIINHHGKSNKLREKCI